MAGVAGSVWTTRRDFGDSFGIYKLIGGGLVIKRTLIVVALAATLLGVRATAAGAQYQTSCDSSSIRR